MDDRQRDLTGAYALDALTESEAREFERHADPAARAEARDLAETASRLAETAPLESPPARLRSSVLAAIRETPQERPAENDDDGARPAQRGGGSSALPAPEREAAVSPVPAGSPVRSTAGSPARSTAEEPRPARAVPGASSRPPRARRLRARAGALLAALCIAAGGFGAGAVYGGKTAERQAASASSSASPGAQAEGSSGAMMAKIGASADAAMVSGRMDGSNVSVTYSKDLDMAVSNSMLPAPPKGKVYVLWLFDEQGNVTAVGELGAAPNGHTPALGELKGGLTGAREFGITVERPGAVTPSYKPFMLAKA
ncbi:anti-sigma factor domain-containing protein [Arthrobacter sp. UM1]|uniref:anti-sigma factor domain-containing protein n=1 Tax=Arthrobacter sp. UM1 TaxID=2766776 RepID=UPI001CF64C40|nr:anti-sigma factor [Arthrobacter sp. UM1]MCB4208041.1 anti-sigma factor [Arthrobacter sp. UM1]